MIYHMISEHSKLVQKEYKTRHDWVGNGIFWELCEKFKFDHTKYYMNNPESILEKGTHKILWGFLDTNRSPNLSQNTRSSDRKIIQTNKQKAI